MEPLEPRISSRFAEVDRILEALLGLSDPGVIELSLERLIDRVAGHSERSEMTERAMSLGLRIHEAARRLARKQASTHNSIAWSLPYDLTVRVFSMLDTRSVCHAAATCSMFNKCAMDSLCYQYIDLTSAETKVNNSVVFAMVQRAAKNLQSLKLGMQSVALRGTRFCQSMVFAAHNPVDTSSFSWHDRRSEQGKISCFLTRSCLLPLTLGNGAIGGLLRQLHLYNIDAMDTATLCTALSVCRSLFDFAVVGLNVNLKQTLKSLSSFCPCLEHLFFESSGTGGDESLKSSTCFDIVNGCPLLSSLALRRFKLNDHKVQILLKVDINS
ncbi:F-box protein [Nymphaea thermarum]|nr:F-box protein [Nymphaea thermarum]